MEAKKEKTLRTAVDKCAELSTKDLLKGLGCDQAKGLTDSDVEARRTTFGENKLPDDEGTPFWQLVLKQFDDLMVKILLAAASVSTLLAFSEMSDGEEGFKFSFAPLVEPFVILVILVINAIVGVMQESNAEEAIEKLKSMQAPPCVVVRNGGVESVVDAKLLVPGDVVHLRTGDRVPADCRLLSINARSIAADQAALTGETDAIDKHMDAVKDPHVLQDKTNMLFTSTLIVRGSGYGIVTTTGEATEFGKIYKSIAECEDEATPLQAKLDEFGEQLGKVRSWRSNAAWFSFSRSWPLAGRLSRGARVPRGARPSVRSDR